LLPLRSIFAKQTHWVWSAPYIFPHISPPGATILPTISDCCRRVRCQDTCGDVALNRNGHLSDISALPNFQSLRTVDILSQNHSTLDADSLVK
jgi:hypothetical protein